MGKSVTANSPEKIYEICRAISTKEERRRRYDLLGGTCGITSSTVFFRDFRWKRDTILPWSEIKRISCRKTRLGTGPKVFLEGENTRITLSIHDKNDQEVLPFLNSLSDHAKKAGVNTGELDAFLEDYFSRSLTDRNLSPLYALVIFVVAIFVLPVQISMQERTPDWGNWFFSRLPENPVAQKYLILGFAFGIAILLGLAFFFILRYVLGKVEKRRRRKKREILESRIAQIDEYAWEIYREKRKSLRNERAENRKKQWNQIENARKFFGETPRRAGKSLGFTIHDEVSVLFGTFFFIPFLIPTFFTIFCIAGLFDENIRQELRWYKWGAAGNAVVSQVERGFHEGRNRYFVKYEITRTLPDGKKLTYGDVSFEGLEKWFPGRVLAIEQYENRSDLFRPMKSGLEKFFRLSLFPVYVGGPFLLYFVLLRRWVFLGKTARNLFENGEMVCGTVPRKTNRFSFIRIGKTRHSFDVLASGVPLKPGVHLFFYRPKCKFILCASSLQKFTRFDPENGIFHFFPGCTSSLLPFSLGIVILEFLAILVSLSYIYLIAS